MRRSPLKRKTRLSPKRATVRRSSRVRDEAYLAWVRLQPCAVGVMLRQLARNTGAHAPFSSSAACWGTTDPEHRREGVGMGMKASDRDSWPCCRGHHEHRHGRVGVFAGWPETQLNEFIRARIAEANAAYERHLAASTSKEIPWT